MAKREIKPPEPARELIDLREKPREGPPELVYIDLEDPERCYIDVGGLQDYYGRGMVLKEMAIYKLDRVVDIQI